MKRNQSWAWAPRAELDPAVERNEVWINPRLPTPRGQALQPLRVELSVLECFQNAFDQIERIFAGDSTLAAIVRQHDTCHFLVYTAITEAAAYDRCRDVRDATRLTSIGCSIAMEPTWQSLIGLDDDTVPATGTPWIADGGVGNVDERVLEDAGPASGSSTGRCPSS